VLLAAQAIVSISVNFSHYLDNEVRNVDIQDVKTCRSSSRYVYHLSKKEQLNNCRKKILILIPAKIQAWFFSDPMPDPSA